MPRSSRWPKKAFLVLASLALTLALGEGGSYLLGRYPPPSAPLQTQYMAASMRQYDHLLFWSLRPGAAGEDGEPWINGLGLRGPEVGPKAPDEYRILSLGESTTFAKRMPYEQCYSALIEEELPGLWRTDRPVRVVNAGVPAYSLFQGYQYLAHRGLELEPDMVLVYFGHNDFLPVSYLSNRATGGGGRTMNDWQLFAQRQSLAGKLSELLTRHSNAYRGLLHFLAGSGRTDEPGAGAEPGDGAADGDADGDGDGDGDPSARRGGAYVEGAPPRVPAEHRRELLGMFRDLCAERGIALVILVPWYRDMDEHAPLLREFAEESGVPIVDLPNVLEPRLRRAKETYFSDKVHPIPEGHALIADAVLELLAELGPPERP